ncbi:unnamed protein product [[Candida] boidinii]|nr:hypothetical protein B5S33_g1654 [[Candida] boidinii]GME98517.1 unnamed protein product [[Candida] boidinii]
MSEESIQQVGLINEEDHRRQLNTNGGGSPNKYSNDILRESLIEIAVGSASGAIAKIVEYPFDTVKVRLQYSQHFDPPLFSSTLDCLQKTYKNEGFYKGFYKGLMSPMIGSALEVSTLFFSYRLAQNYLNYLKNNENLQAELKMSEKLLCGAISGVVTSFILTPIELLKCKLQVDNLERQKNINSNISTNNKNSGKLIPLIKSIYKEHGLKGLWKGQIPTCIREAGGSAAWFGCYEYALEVFREQNIQKSMKVSHNNDEFPKHNKQYDGSDYSASQLLFAGAMAGIGYNASLFPADTIKNMMQTQGGKEKGDNFLTISLKVYKKNGIRGFYSGLGVTLFKSIPASAVMFYCYEIFKKELNGLTSP